MEQEAAPAAEAPAGPANAARAEIDRLMGDPALASARTDPKDPLHSVAVTRFAELERAASAPPTVDTRASDAARTERATLLKNKAFAQAFNNSDPAISEPARERMQRLNEAAFPGEVDLNGDPTLVNQVVAAEAARPEDTEINPQDTKAFDASVEKFGRLPFAPNENLSAQQLMTLQVAATETADNLGVDSDTLNGSIKLLEMSHKGRLVRDGETGQMTPRPMDDLELAKFEHILHEKTGDDYDAAMDRMEAALNKAGKRGGPWLQQSILRSDPRTAAEMALRLAGLAK